MLKSNTLEINTKGKVCYITFPKLSQCGKVRHAFTTRMGGKSEGIFCSMNMSLTIGDCVQTVKQNYNILCSAANLSYNNLVLSHQTHTDNLRVITENDIGKGIFVERDYCNIDGLITNCKNIPLVTQYADCTPLLFCDPVKEVVATSHAGWRGTVKQIGAKTVKKMQKEFGCDPKNIIAAIGPCICENCYEVDTPVYKQFKENTDIELDKIFTPTYKDHYQLDLREANRQILLSAGVLFENIDVSDLCTCCNHEWFHSHRYTGGKRGTLAAIIELI